MQFRDLQKQYQVLKKDIDSEIQKVLVQSNFISGFQVVELEKMLADYVGVKHCVTCANGTDALSLALMVWNIGPGDAVFVPDFTFFSTGEIVAFAGATPIFVDVEEVSFNMSPESLEKAIQAVLREGKLKPRAIIPVDLFGQPADFLRIHPIAQKYNLLILEDGAQGFGGKIGEKRSCSFGDMATTSFFPAKPLGCYGDGGAIFTDNDEWDELLRSLRVHGKGENKYDNIRIGMNSRLDTLQAAILQVKLKAFQEYELDAVNEAAERYHQLLGELVNTPRLKDNFYSSWAQYSILLKGESQRDELQNFLNENKIPTMVYYSKPMSKQKAFEEMNCVTVDLSTTEDICKRVLSLPLSPYISCEEQIMVVNEIKNFLSK